MLFKSKRSETDIINEILVETRDGIKKTQLMYKTKMSNMQLSRYLEKLIERQIMEVKIDSNGDTFYYLTEGGKRLISPLQQVISILCD